MCHCFQGIYCLRSGRCPSLSNHRSRWYKSLYKCSANTMIIWLEKHFWSHSNSTSVQIFVLHIYGSVCLLPVWDQQFSTLLFCIYMVQFNFYLNTWLFYIWFSSLSSCLRPTKKHNISLLSIWILMNECKMVAANSESWWLSAKWWLSCLCSADSVNLLNIAKLVVP